MFQKLIALRYVHVYAKELHQLLECIEDVLLDFICFGSERNSADKFGAELLHSLTKLT